MWLLQAVVSFVKIEGLKTMHYFGIEKLMTLFLPFSPICIQHNAAVHVCQILSGDCEPHDNT
jgi:hypothetical protein